MTRDDIAFGCLLLLLFVLFSAVILISFANKEARLAGKHECEWYADEMMWRVPAKCQTYFLNKNTDGE